MSVDLEHRKMYGARHGTHFYYSKRNPNSFLDYMEKRMVAEAFEAYMTGFMEGMDGKWRYRWARAREERKEK